MDLWTLAVCYLNDDDDDWWNRRFKTNIYVEEEESNVHTARLYMGGGEWIERLFVKCTIWLIDMTQLTLVVIQRVSILKYVRLHCMLCLCLYFAVGSLLALMETIITLTHTYNDLITIRKNLSTRWKEKNKNFKDDAKYLTVVVVLLYFVGCWWKANKKLV